MLTAHCPGPVNGSWLFLGHPEQDGCQVLQDASKDLLPVRWALSFPETTVLVCVPCAQLLPQPWKGSGSSGCRVCPHPGGPGSSPTNIQNGCNGTPSGGVSLPRSAGAGGHPRLFQVLCPLGPRTPCFPASPFLIRAALLALPQLSELECGRPGAQRPSSALCPLTRGRLVQPGLSAHPHLCVPATRPPPARLVFLWPHLHTPQTGMFSGHPGVTCVSPQNPLLPIFPPPQRRNSSFKLLASVLG